MAGFRRRLRHLPSSLDCFVAPLLAMTIPPPLLSVPQGPRRGGSSIFRWLSLYHRFRLWTT